MLLAALLAGLAGSGHCVAMCGGIAAALGAGGAAGRAQPLAYNLGRITSYAVAGAIMGALGAGVLSLAAIATLRGAAQVFAGVALVTVGAQLALGRRFAWIERAGHVVWRALGPLARGALSARTFAGAFRTGLVWGWLPCGMAYAMLLLAAANLDPARGAPTMLAFGIGTLPALLAVGHGASGIVALARRPAWRAGIGVAVIALGVASVSAPWLPMQHHALLALLDCR